MRFSASFFVVPVCLGVVLAACSSDAVGGLCAKSKDCAKQANATFDDMACKSELKGYRDSAVSKSCAGQFDEAINCIAAQSCTATEAQITSACATKISALEAACNKASGDGGGGTEGGSVLPPPGGDQCTAVSKCPNDPPKTQASIDACRSGTAMQMTKCPNESKAFGTCFYNNWTCDADGKTDALGTIAKCQAEQDALLKCVG